MRFSHHLILDLEATCNNDSSFPREEMEIIEIGAVMVSDSSYEIDSEFQIFVQPVRNPVLSTFCKELTNISQENLHTAPKFPEAIEKLLAWLQPYDDYDFCSWGYYDYKQFAQDCEYHKVPYPISAPHRNLKKEFSDFLGVKKGFGLSKALKRIGEPFDGIHHRGLDDAKNIAKIFKHMAQNWANN